jgi:hypothetical protein
VSFSAESISSSDVRRLRSSLLPERKPLPKCTNQGASLNPLLFVEKFVAMMLASASRLTSPTRMIARGQATSSWMIQRRLKKFDKEGRQDHIDACISGVYDLAGKEVLLGPKLSMIVMSGTVCST